MPTIRQIVPCLWFDNRAEEAVKHYTSIFKDAKILEVTRYGKAGHEIHHHPEGSVLTIDFELDGNRFTALNGGPEFKFSEAVSLQVFCDTQEEIDAYWSKLSAGGDPSAQQCGWLKDRYGVSWQIVPGILQKLLKDYQSPKGQAAMSVMMRMKKLDIAELQAAYDAA